MGSEQLAGAMREVEGNSAEAKGIIIRPEKLDDRVKRFQESVERDSECYRTSSAMLDDGIIDPRDTRDVLGIFLEIVMLQKVDGADCHQVWARLCLSKDLNEMDKYITWLWNMWESLL